MSVGQYNSASSVYSEPPTFLEILIETSDMLDRQEKDVTASKQDVLDSVRERLSLIIGKLVAVPTSTSFSLFRSNSEIPPVVPPAYYEQGAGTVNDPKSLLTSSDDEA
jgi:hypothetical protein